MAKQFPSISSELKAFIERQHIFFTASATADSRINLSPKGLDGFRVVGDNEVCYLDHTGSGNEAAAHLMADGRLTVMFCAFEGPPMILRLYGRGRVARKGTDEYARYLAGFFDGNEPAGARQIVIQDIDSARHAASACRSTSTRKNVRRSSAGPSKRARTASPNTGRRKTASASTVCRRGWSRA